MGDAEGQQPPAEAEAAAPHAPAEAAGAPAPPPAAAVAAAAAAGRPASPQELWADFAERLRGRGCGEDGILCATTAELEEILTELGYRALERAQLRTQWHARLRERGGAAAAAGVSESSVVAPTSREFADVRVLLERYASADTRRQVSIVELERLSNPLLGARFERRKAEMADGSAGVVRRFYPCTSTQGPRIQDAGFALPCGDAAPHCIRFLTKCSAPFPPGAHRLLLCDVAVGKYKAVNSSSNAQQVTPEQLSSEGFDSIYLFCPSTPPAAPPRAPPAPVSPAAAAASPARQRVPDEFLLFHPDQALPRYAVTFIVHARLDPASPTLAPHPGSASQQLVTGPPALQLLGDSSPRDLAAGLAAVSPLPPAPSSQPGPRDATPRPDLESPLLHSPRSADGGGESPLRYWLPDENRLVLADSLLIGEHKGKRFMPVGEAAERQMLGVAQKGERLLRSIERLKQQLEAQNRQREGQAEARAAAHAAVRSWAQQLHSAVDEKQGEALRLVEERMTIALGRLGDDAAALGGHLDKLEAYSQRVNQVLVLARSNRDEFLLRSVDFLEDMDRWEPPYHFTPEVTVPPLLEFDMDHTAAEAAVRAAQPRQRPDDASAQPQRRRQQGARAGRAAARAAPGWQEAPPPGPPPPPPPPLPQQQQQQQPQQRSLPAPRSASPSPSGAEHVPMPPLSPGVWPSDHGGAPGGGGGGGRFAGTPRGSGHREGAHSPPPPRPAPEALEGAGASERWGPRRAGSRSRRPRAAMPSFRVALIGDPRVGKTRLMEVWRGDEPPRGAAVDEYTPTTAAEPCTFTVVTAKGAKVLVTVVDTGGAQLCPDVLATADAAVVVFDCTSRSSYHSVRRWYSYLPHGIPVALCGNKSSESARVIRARDITFHREVNAALRDTVMNYYDISVLSRYNVDKPWTWICRKLLKDSQLVIREIVSS